MQDGLLELLQLKPLLVYKELPLVRSDDLLEHVPDHVLDSQRQVLLNVVFNEIVVVLVGNGFLLQVHQNLALLLFVHLVL